MRSARPRRRFIDVSSGISQGREKRVGSSMAESFMELSFDGVGNVANDAEESTGTGVEKQSGMMAGSFSS